MSLDQLAVDASRMTVEHRTGTEWYSYEIIRALMSINDRPHLNLYHRSSTPTSDCHGISHHHVRMPRLWTHAGLSLAMFRDKPDALLVPAHVVPVHHPAATVVTIHDLGYLAEPQTYTHRRRTMLDLTTLWNVRASRRIIAISEQTRSDIVARYQADPDKIDIIHHGVDQQRFRQLPDSQVQPVLDRYGLEQPYILFVSTIQPRKNLHRLITAFEQMGEESLSLVLAGKPGWLESPIRRRIEGSPLAGQIHRLGHVADDDLPALYNGAEVFALPSLYEGFGMGVLEAMACGCPVVTSDRSSLPEISGDAAEHVDPRSVASIIVGLRRAMIPSVRASLVDAGLRRAQQFTWQRAAELTMETIRQAYRETHG